MPETRSALIVATYAYDDAAGLNALRAPRQDAEALSKVLGDPNIGGFDVRTVINQPAHVVNLEVARFFANRRPDDLLLLHFSCHGVKDDAGELYFAATDTRLDLLEASSVSAAFVNKVMDRSRSSRVVLLLDCCYAGAFARGMSSRGGSGLDIQERLAGRGRAVITASTSLQFAFEDGDLADGDADERPSVFTRSLVEGLTSGEADRDQDGIIGLDELYGYLYDAVTAATPNQTPGKWAFGLEGDLHIARRSTPVTVPAQLPPEVEESLASSIPWHRESVIPELERVLRGSHPGRALAARLALEKLCDDDSRHVAAHALTVLSTVPRQRAAPEPTPPVPDQDPITDFLPIPVPEEPPAPVPERDVEPVQPEPVQPEPVRSEPVQFEPVDLEPVDLDPTDGVSMVGGRPFYVEEPPTRVAVPPVRPAASGAGSGAAPGAVRSRRWWPAAAAALLVLVVAGTWWALSSGDDADRAKAGGARLPDDLLVLARAEGARSSLLTYDSTTGQPVPGGHTLVGRLPTISPQRHLIAYAAGPHAFEKHPRFTPFLARADLTRPHPLFTDPPTWCTYTTRVAWQPGREDRLVVACKDAHNNNTALRVVDSSGRFQGPMRSVPDLVRDPTWTRDGKIVFARKVQPKHETLWTLPSDLRGDPKRYFRKGSAAAPGTSSDRFPDASARGLLFLRIPADPRAKGGVDLSRSRVMIADPQGHVHEVAGIPPGVEVPTWSPDERSIGYLVPVTDKLFWLGILGPGSSQGRLVTPKEEPIGAPAWGSR